MDTEALYIVDAHVRDDLTNLLGFDILGDGTNTQRMGNVDD